ncbi:MAG: hypothetical protein HN936_05595 [Bacteroidetes bacterium]|jgi:ribonuclease III|nr:hypothetical protein [Bacteroidota bacterium]
MDIESVQECLGIEFKDPNLLIEALTHSSNKNESEFDSNRSNEALAWLGDALIDWVVSESIYSPGSTKGGLTKSRERKVNEIALADLAINLGLDKVLIIPEHRVLAGGRKNQKNLHTVYEAVVGAIYRDQGFESAKDFVVRTCI